MKKKLLTTLAVTAIAATSLVGLTGCNPKAAPTNKKVTAQDIFSMSAVSGASYLGQSGSAGASALAETTASTFTRPNGITDSVVEDFKTYLVMFEEMLENGGFDIQVSAPTGEDGKYAIKEVKDGENVLHSTKMAVNVAGDKYVMYYTEITNSGKIVDKDDINEVKEKSTFSGVLVRGEEAFAIYGMREVETEVEDGETETEVSITFTTKSADGSYVTIKQSVEEETENGVTETETSYKYKVVNSAGVTVSEFEIEWEVEDGKTEMSVEFNGVEYEIKKVGENKFRVEYENGKREIKFNIEKVGENTYNFVYGQGNVEEVVITPTAE